jgi:hypothetical protein
MTTEQPTLTITCNPKADLAAAGLLPTYTDAYAHGTDATMERIEQAEEHLIFTYGDAWADAAYIAGVRHGYQIRAITTDDAELTADINGAPDYKCDEARTIWQAAHDRLTLAIHTDGTWTLKNRDGYLINPYVLGSRAGQPS